MVYVNNYKCSLYLAPQTQKDE